MAHIDVKDIEKIVFNKQPAKAYGDPINQSSVEYVEEESYVNPPNIEFQSDCDYED